MNDSHFSVPTLQPAAHAPGMTVLYVEDEDDDAFFVRRAFNNHGLAAALTVVDDGTVAISYLSGRSPFSNRNLYPLPSLVVLDANLPQLSGYDVLAWMRTTAPLTRIPAIIFSAFGEPENRQRARSLGAREFVLKAAGRGGFDELVAAVLRHMPEPAAPTALSRHR